jgi:hypothetical protein
MTADCIAVGIEGGIEIGTESEWQCPLQASCATFVNEVTRQQFGLHFLAPAEQTMGHNKHFIYMYCALLFRVCKCPPECVSARRFFNIAVARAK